MPFVSRKQGTIEPVQVCQRVVVTDRGPRLATPASPVATFRLAISQRVYHAPEERREFHGRTGAALC
jgi:hypothetical protein